MAELQDFLKRILSLPGLSGFEDPVREVIAEQWRPLVDELSVSKIGSLHGIKRGSGPEPRPRILLSAHMDAIGLMVTRILPGGFLGFTEVGGVDPRILVSTPVRVFGRRELPGIVVQPADRLLPAAARGKPAGLEHLLIDTGLSEEEVRAVVRVGDPVSFDTQPTELPGDLICGHTLDDRAAVAAVTACLEELSGLKHAWDVYAVASVQEEETLGGAFTSPYEIRPDIAVAVDVTFAKGPGVNDYRGRPLGSGAALAWGPNTHPAVFEGFKAVAERLDIPYEIEVYHRYSGTDAMAMQIVAEGIPTMVIGIPLRYMHTPVEMVSIKDIRRSGRLMAQYIASLAPDAIQQIKWDGETA